MKLSKVELKLYHSHTIRNMEELGQSQKCGCMACCSIYNADEIEEYITESNDDEKTALCAKCGTDAVIGDATGLEISEEILKALNKFWF